MGKVKEVLIELIERNKVQLENARWMYDKTENSPNEQRYWAGRISALMDAEIRYKECLEKFGGAT